MSGLQPWEHLGDRLLVRYKVFDVLEARRRSPRTGAEHGMFIVRTADWVNVVAFTEADELVLVRQWRQGSTDFTLEIPGGMRHGDEDPALCAARELREETGHAAGELIRLGAVNPNNALFTNRCDTYLALSCRRVGALQMDPGEDIEVVTMPLAEVEERVRAGEIDHALVLAGLYFHRLHLER